MSALKSLRLAREAGIRIALSGTDLALEAEQEPAPALLEMIKRNKAEIVAWLAANCDGWTAEDWQTLFDERSWSAEVYGGQTRDQAEATAFECCIVEWLNRHPCRSDPGACAACGGPDRAASTVVPFGTEDHGHTWLHPECWERWYKERRQQARQFLFALGIKSHVATASRANLPNDFGKNRSA